MDLGAEDVNGNTIIPIQNKYRRLLYIRGYFEVVDQRKKNIGVYDKNGNEIISTNRGYGGCFIEEDCCIEVYNLTGHGVCTLNGKEIISPNRGYDQVILIDNHIYVRIGKSKGVCDVTTGKEIISPNRGYTDVQFYDEENHFGYYGVKRGEKEGACDINGREIIPPIYHRLIYSEGFNVKRTDHDKWNDTGITLNKRGIASQYSSGSSFSANSSNSSVSELLYSGIYTISGQGRSGSTGQFTNDIGDQTCEVKIYEKYIFICDVRYDFKKKSGSTRVYEGSGVGVSFNGMSSYDTYSVDDNFNIRKTTIFSSPYGMETFSYSVSKGETTMPKYSNSSSSGSYSGSSSSRRNSGSRNIGSSSNRKACTACKFTNGKCPVCKGTKKMHGFYGAIIDCSNCGKTGRCPICGGSGFVN